MSVPSSPAASLPRSGPSSRTAVLLMAHGGPSSLDEVEAYLRNVRGGRPTPPELVAEIRRRYDQIGGRSPLLEITLAQAQALEERLNSGLAGRAFRVYVGMRHWRPYIREAVEQIAQSGLRKLVAICLTPQYSRASVGAYFQRLGEAQAELGAQLDTTCVESWHDHPLFVQALAAKVTEARQRLPIEARDRVRMVFTAHSLPVSTLGEGDPYEAQVLETARLVAGILGLMPDEWQCCYQSAGARQGQWLGPSLEDVVVDLAEAGQRHILVAPIGFVSDHVEVLYDIDIEARSVARRAGANLERTESLSVAPLFIDALADIVRRRLAGA